MWSSQVEQPPCLPLTRALLGLKGSSLFSYVSTCAAQGFWSKSHLCRQNKFFLSSHIGDDGGGAQVGMAYKQFEVENK